MYFFPYSWHVRENEIHVYGFEKSEDSSTEPQMALLRLTEFTPYVYVKLSNQIDWSPTLVHRLVQSFRRNSKIFKSSLMYKRPLYYANVHFEKEKIRYDLHPYLFLAFESEKERKQFVFNTKKQQNILGLGQVNLEFYEHNATPVLQLTCIREISTADWFQVKKPQRAVETISRVDREYTTHWKTLFKVDEETKLKLGVPAPLIMSYDIECNFHDPNKFSDGSHVNDVVFQISCVFGKASAPKETWESYLLTLGNPDDSLLQNVTVLRFRKEFQLLMGFCDLIIKKNPQILIGYNIFKFDIPFLYKRSIQQSIHDDFVRHGCTREKCKLETIKWSSSAYSNQEMNFIDLQGRMTIDLLTLIQRDFNLENYKLDTVAEKFLGRGKDPLNHFDIFMCYELGIRESKEGLSKSLGLVGKYCVKDSVLVLELFEKFQYWYSLTEMAKICQVPHSHLFLYGQQLKVFSQVYKYCYHNGIVVESGRFKTAEDELCTGAYVFTPEPGLYDNVVSFDFCLTGNALVSTIYGYSRRIDSMILDEPVLGFKNIGLYPFWTVNGLQVKGLRSTIQLVFEDGQTLTCTPDHKIMTEHGKWVQAHLLKGEYVMRGLEYPEDRICPFEEEWLNDIYGLELNMKGQRDRTLAYARMLGYAIAESKVSFVSAMDADRFSSDLNWFPNVELVQLDYSFVFDPKCPLSILREFLGGVYGRTYKSEKFEPLLKRFNVEPDTLEFAQKIGYRYNTEKSLQATLLKSFSGINSNQTFEEYLKYVRADQWEKNLSIHQGIPCFRNRVVEIIPGGLEWVYDIEVQDAHCFVANGIVVSNCSLYPSIIISHNIDYTTLIQEKDVARIPEDKYKMIKWGEHINCRCPDSTLTKDKDQRCKNYKYYWLREPTGVLPTIIKNLLDARKHVRNQMKQVEPSSLLYNILNKRQLAYKVSSNSMYGALSTKKGYLPFMPAGMCVTAIGRQSIEKVSHIIQQEHQGKIVYGDSVLGNTPLLLRDPRTRKIIIRTIETLVREQDWKSYPGFKIFDLSIRLEKQYASCNYEVWSDKGWSPIRKVIRHKTEKQIYKVTTNCGIVYVTEDHSLLTHDGEKVRPGDIRPRQLCLLHKFPDLFVSQKAVPGVMYNLGRAFKGYLPDHVLNADSASITSYIQGYVSKHRVFRFDDAYVTQQFYVLLRRAGYRVHIREDQKYYVLYPLNFIYNAGEIDYLVKSVTKVSDVNTSQFVYDLETDCGHFQAGIGEMIVKNTDSNYVMFPHLTDLKQIWEHSVKVSEEVSKRFPEPMRLEFEEHIYARYLILSKKRYLYFTVTPEGKMSTKIENKGVLLKRRDNSKVIRDIYEDVIRMVLNRTLQVNLISKFAEYVDLMYVRHPNAEDYAMSKSVKGIENFVITPRDTKTIQYGDYVVPRLKDNPVDRAAQLEDKGASNEATFYQAHLPGAVQLALRMRSRGQHIESGSRLSYVVTRRVEHRASVTDKMEEMEYFKLNYSKQMIDVLHYLHLLINPIEEVLTVMYGNQYKNFVKDMYKYRIKYDAVVHELYQLFNQLCFEGTARQLRITSMFKPNK
jgi:DNA polymerase elongation subunit (family B)